MLEERVRELKQIIAGNDGHNAADRDFVRAVDETIGAVYDDIGEIRQLSTRALFDLFVIKVLYVGRHSRHADVIEYLGGLLDSYLFTRALYPAGEDGRPRTLYFSDMLDDEKRPQDVPNVFDAYRRYADSALFLSGVFPDAAGRRRRSQPGALRRRSAPMVDAAYYATTGKAMYRMAARDAHSDCEHQPDTLTKLADHFDVYVDALNEMSARYLMGFDAGLIADKMLDAFNRHRATGGSRALHDAGRYAALLDVTADDFPSLGPH
jgi:hypothetical protein